MKLMDRYQRLNNKGIYDNSTANAIDAYYDRRRRKKRSAWSWADRLLRELETKLQNKLVAEFIAKATLHGVKPDVLQHWSSRSYNDLTEEQRGMTLYELCHSCKVIDKTERKRLLRRYHPDNLDTGDIKKFQEINR
jgi:hypothetical protein